ERLAYRLRLVVTGPRHLGAGQFRGPGRVAYQQPLRDSGRGQPAGYPPAHAAGGSGDRDRGRAVCVIHRATLPAAPATAPPPRRPPLHGARPGRPGFTPCRRLTAAVVDLRVTETDLRNRFQITLWTRPPRACSATWAGGLWLATSRGRGPGVTRV